MHKEQVTLDGSYMHDEDQRGIATWQGMSAYNSHGLAIVFHTRKLVLQTHFMVLPICAAHVSHRICHQTSYKAAHKNVLSMG